MNYDESSQFLAFSVDFKFVLPWISNVACKIVLFDTDFFVLLIEQE